MKKLISIHKQISCNLANKNFSTLNDIVQIEKNNPFVTEIRLNQPKKLNSLDIPVIELMISEIKSWHKNNKFPKVIVFV